jgi:hypothetical protein
MKTIDEIRRDKLKMLAAEHGGIGVFATKIGKSSAQLSQWINASPDSKTGKPRGMRAESCRHIEQLSGLKKGWMDQESSEIISNSTDAHDQSSEQIFRSKVKLSPNAARLINEIIAAEERGSSSPQIIEVLSKVLHVAIPATEPEKHSRISKFIDDE